MLQMAEVTRSLLSLTAVSGNPDDRDLVGMACSHVNDKLR
jgi:hypothetical protein